MAHPLACICMEMCILFIIVKQQEGSSAGGGRKVINLLCFNLLGRLPKQPGKERVFICECMSVYPYLMYMVKCVATVWARKSHKKKVIKLILVPLSGCVDMERRRPLFDTGLYKRQALIPNFPCFIKIIDQIADDANAKYPLGYVLIRIRTFNIVYLPISSPI